MQGKCYCWIPTSVLFFVVVADNKAACALPIGTPIPTDSLTSISGETTLSTNESMQTDGSTLVVTPSPTNATSVPINGSTSAPTPESTLISASTSTIYTDNPLTVVVGPTEVSPIEPVEVKDASVQPIELATIRPTKIVTLQSIATPSTAAVTPMPTEEMTVATLSPTPPNDGKPTSFSKTQCT